MISNRIREKGLLAKLLEKGIKILVRKECKKIGKIKVDIIASSIQILKGTIQKINIIAQDINYKNLLFDEIELESNEVKVKFKITNKELNFKNDCKIKFRISLSDTSIKTILLSNNWNWIGNIISKEILNKSNLGDIKIKHGEIFITASKGNKDINEEENLKIKAEEGKLYLENKGYNKSIKIPIEDKIYIKDVNIENNLINIFANSSISF